LMNGRSIERNKPRLETVLFCDHATVTTEGKAILWGIFNRALIDPEAEAQVLCYLFVRTVETVEEAIRIRVLDPNGRVVVEGAGDEPDREAPWPRYVQTLQRVILSQLVEGLYWVDVVYKGLSLGGAHLIVEFGKMAPEKRH
jgi:hypothetical protein